MEQVTKYFVTGHTAEGFVNYLATNLLDIDRVVVLQHPSNVLKTKVLQRLIDLYEKNQAIELICSPLNRNYVDGIIIRSLSLAFIADHIIDSKSNLQIQTVKLDPSATISESQDNLQKEINQLQEKAYPHFKASLMIHDHLEKVFINEMDFEKADKIADDFIQSLLKDVLPQKRQSVVYERLFGTNTPDGFINHLEKLIESVDKRFFIKGRAGTGKSFFMNKVLEQCKLHGIDVELYRCSFDPNSIDMLIMRQLNTCLFDSTPPHELFPSRETDKVIDFYEKTVTPGTDEKYVTQIKQFTTDYKAEMSRGLDQLKAVKLIEENREKKWQKVREDEIEAFIEKIKHQK